MQLKLEKTTLGCRLEISDCAGERDEDVLIAGINKLCGQSHRKIELFWINESPPSAKIAGFIEELKERTRKAISLQLISSTELKALEAEVAALEKTFKDKNGPEILELKKEIIFLRSQNAQLEQIAALLSSERPALKEGPTQQEIIRMREELHQRFAVLWSET